MANAIGLNYSTLFKNNALTGKRYDSGKNISESKNSAASFEKNFSVELSDSGLNALANLQNDSVEKNSVVDEKKLSAKAQDYLDKLREKYGDYDFIVADNVDDPQSFSQQSSRNYSVILSSEEIEKMANDEEYAAKVMGHVDAATGILEEVSAASLESGVQFSSLAASVDDDGNMKLFAGLEKMSEEQRERLEELKEKRAEEKNSENDDEKEQVENFSVKSFQVEADSPDKLFEKIFGINWDEIEEEQFEFIF